MSKYSVFISYRRTGFETANLIAEKLRSYGYSVFFDVESLRGGKFNEQLFKMIDECKDFILVLPERALDRCSNEDGSANEEDWVRKEVSYALQHQKNIIPVMLNGFEWPNPMPHGLESLKDYQAVTSTSHEYFDLLIKRLCGYMESRRRPKIMIQRALAIIAVIAAVLVMSFYLLRILGRSQCENVAGYLTGCTACVHDAYSDVKDLHKEWESYWTKRSRAQSWERKKELDDNLKETLHIYENRNQQLRTMIPPTPELGIKDAFLLGVYGTLSLEIEMNDIYVRSYCDDLDSLISTMYDAIGEMDGYLIDDWKQKVSLEFELYDHMVGMFYASYLGEMSRLPQSAKKLHDSMKKSWILFPIIPENLVMKEYENMIMGYVDKSEYCISEIQRIVDKQEHQVDEMQDYLDSLSIWVDEVEQNLDNINRSL